MLDTCYVRIAGLVPFAVTRYSHTFFIFCDFFFFFIGGIEKKSNKKDTGYL